MKQSICILDDYLPAERFAEFMNTNELLNRNNLKHMLTKEEEWGDKDLLRFVKSVYEKNDFLISGFTSHEFFLKYCEESPFVPDIVVFDWDINGQTDESKANLIEVLESLHCFIAIFTNADKENEVTGVIQSPEFKDYTGRLILIKKNEADCVEKLIQIIEERIESNFSLKFGKMLINKSNESINKALVELGNATVNQIEDYFKITNDSKKDLIDFLGERYKFHLKSLDYKGLDTPLNEGNDTNSELVKRIWNYRLYLSLNDIQDNTVRKGDIIEKKHQLYLIISADCDLSFFWNKNFGQLNLIPLHKISKGNESLKSKLTLTKSAGDLKKNFTQSSLTNKINEISEGPFILPFIRRNGSFENYLCFPKEIEHITVNHPEISKDNLKKIALKYSSLEDINLICSISEPFLTPLISHLLNTIYGYGTPDYPKIVKDTIMNDSKPLFE
ncbi:MAG: hypothetical protein NTY07_05390 [Bacteroidia bacterium]|nr:hypothetical protein [Bacteroidia bacterium]